MVLRLAESALQSGPNHPKTWGCVQEAATHDACPLQSCLSRQSSGFTVEQPKHTPLNVL